MNEKITFSKFIDMLSISNTNPKYIFLPDLLDAFVGGKITDNSIELPNLCDDANPNTLKSKANGKRNITKTEAKILYENVNLDKLETYLHDLISDSNFISIRKNLNDYGFIVNPCTEDSEIPLICAKLLKKIIYNISFGKQETLPPIEILNTKNLNEIAFKSIFFDDNYLIVNGEKIKLSKDFSSLNSTVNYDLKFIQKLFEIYSEKLGKRITNENSLKGTPYLSHLNKHNQFYFEAKYKEFAAREIFEDGEKQINKIKKEIEDAIYDCVYFENFSNGLDRLTNAMNLIVKAQLNSSLLLKINGFIDDASRKGILHILVEEGKIKSWVSPNE